MDDVIHAIEFAFAMFGAWQLVRLCGSWWQARRTPDMFRALSPEEMRLVVEERLRREGRGL